jgi:protoheme IX farnesyltransferase
VRVEPNTGALPRSTAASLAADLWELTKPGITCMVVVTAALGFLVGAEGPLPLPLFLHAMLGTGLVSAGASALNHLLERETDARMRRTSRRPLPAGRLDPDQVLLFGVTLAVAGLAVLAFLVELLAALLGATALAGYVFVYTPLKRRSSLATVVGAVPGAIPPMMGWAAVRGELDPGSWVLFGILFLWQLPHFLAIAWLCRDDYARAGLPMLTVFDRDGTRTARQAVLYCAALLPVSLLPSALGLAGAVYFLGTLILGLAFLGFCLAFARWLSAASARRLLVASVLYLPALLAIMMIDRFA